jgi:hypothetical protein
MKTIPTEIMVREKIGELLREESRLDPFETGFAYAFFDHWLIATGPNQFKLNGKYEDFLKAHAEHFQSYESETDD